MKQIVATILLALPSMVFAHGGGLNSSGCHNDYVHGGYHCHPSNHKAETSPERPINTNVTQPTAPIKVIGEDTGIRTFSKVLSNPKLCFVMQRKEGMEYINNKLTSEFKTSDTVFVFNFANKTRYSFNEDTGEIRKGNNLLSVKLSTEAGSEVLTYSTETTGSVSLSALQPTVTLKLWEYTTINGNKVKGVSTNDSGWEECNKLPGFYQ